MTFQAGIRVYGNAQELSRFAAEQFVALAIEAQRRKGLFTVGLAGGSTPKTLYELLGNENELYRSELCWEKIHVFWGDERHVPTDHPDSNYRMAREGMLSKVPLPSNNIHRIKSEMDDAHAVAAEYEQTLREFFGLAGGEFPRFDLLLLGMGSDGHTASIFPYSDVINENDRLVNCDVDRQVQELPYQHDSSRPEQCCVRHFSGEWRREGKGSARGPGR
jgi:6-phosphogluconolactonase